MKVCIKCRKNKPLDEYHDDIRKPQGKVLYCKSCLENYSRWRHRSKDGFLKELCGSVVSRAHKYRSMDFNRKTLREWVVMQSNFEELFDNWVTSDYDHWLIPSIDRIYNDKGYVRDNMQLMTWRENMLKR